MPSKKFQFPLLIFFFILSALSLLRLLRITFKTSSKTPFPPTIHPKPLLTCTNLPPNISHTLITHQSSSLPYPNGELTHKELCFLLTLVSTRTPMNLLVFGMRHQAPLLAALNSGGQTVFLEDMSSVEVARLRFQGLRIHKVEHCQPVAEAYDLLRRARGRAACGFRGTLRDSECELAMRGLPREVYKRKWDMVVVDGPDGSRLDAAGRMAAIYSAGVLARMGSNSTKVTDIVVHDVDRTVERWYSWEFLCEENLASAKGRFWHFRIKASVSSVFCSNSDAHADH
ncbi:Glucuronoxylan 4-O-methyltransferase 2 [Nymphaea thermarum]|nr:Glucuronoxylan 4-O-methyltransferase 2 [Nymphaea thermarum]